MLFTLQLLVLSIVEILGTEILSANELDVIDEETYREPVTSCTKNWKVSSKKENGTSYGKYSYGDSVTG